MWQCFLRSSTNSIRYNYDHGAGIELTGVDGAKLQCCNKAITYRCRDLCVRVCRRPSSSCVFQIVSVCVCVRASSVKESLPLRGWKESKTHTTCMDAPCGRGTMDVGGRG